MEPTGTPRARQPILLDTPVDRPPTAGAPIAGISPLASKELLARLHEDPFIQEHALIGPLTTENLGVEKLIHTTVQLPSLRFLILCGQDARGHFGGQAVLSLLERGTDASGRILGARGPRPLLANVREDAVNRFRAQVTGIDMIGCEEPELIHHQLTACIADYPGAFAEPGLPAESAAAGSAYEVRASYDKYRDWVADPSGFFLITVDRDAGDLVCEHYVNSRELHVVIRGDSAAAVLHTIVQYQLVSRLDHATYLGRELEKAELALATGISYEQDLPLQIDRGASAG